ncbi:Bardet-Biedl syndrome 2 protein homolog [Microplitis demolitor]|uniref:Bardet-Biedl syndrome 2 protein homolog n=1 Tax=Microplitis demolitor TaxID=69319 RepID=UPI0004CDA0DC|nr:Bardet-Biedl syndrome 2 protein homolog [Microplitis demolitor]
MAAFTLNLDRKILPTLVTCGKFDGSHACLAVATSSGNVLIHSPHRQLPTDINETPEDSLEKRLKWNGELAELQIGKQVLSLCTGRLTEDERDILLIGTLTHILAYQVEENADLFYKNIPDGVYSITIGKLSWLSNQVTVIGSNCSITILDGEGNEIFWTIMGGIVTSLAIFDFDGDGESELLTGTEDCEIKVFKADVILWEIKETAPVTALLALPGRQFAYVVDNGTVGIYESGQRLWRIKSKHKVVSIRSFDVNGDGKLELVTGWSSGKMDARSCVTGDVTFRIQLNAGVAGIVEADYRRTGRPDLVIVSIVGEVRGYGAGLMISTPEPGELIRKFIAKKQALLMELRQRGANFQNYLGSKLAVNMFPGKGAVRLALAAGPGLLIYCVIVFAEGVFEGETMVVHPNRPEEELEIELKPDDNMTVDIHVKVCVGTANTDLYQVFEIVRQLPQFCMYEIISRPENLSEEFKNCGVVFEISERLKRIALWLNQSFLLTKEFDVPDEGPTAGFIEFWLRGMRDSYIHCIRASASGKASLQTEDMNFAGDVIQSLATYLGIQELGSEARFPIEELKLCKALERVKGLREVDARLQADAAGDSTLLKNLVIRLEDARILNDVEGMKKRLLQLKNVNSDLMRENEIRTNSSRELASTLRELNVGVRKASRLRVGRASTNTISRCRTAIQDENPKALIQALQNG